jgi:hypothetical protein
MNNHIIEAYNLNEVSAIFLKKGFMLYRPEADVDGVDFIIQTPENNFLNLPNILLSAILFIYLTTI